MECGIERLDRLCLAMTAYEEGDPGRIQHFVKVHAFARLIGIEEGLQAAEQEILEAAAYVHDIGIKPSLEKYGDCSGKKQEAEGPAPAAKMLRELGFSEETTERVAWLVAHHHTYEGIDSADWQILVEADFLVNLFEGNNDRQGICRVYETVFRTTAGKQLCKTMFGL